MKNKILKWTGAVLLSILTLVIAGYALIAFNVKNRSAKKYTFEAEHLTIPTDSITIARGKHLSIIKGCQDCHAADLSGKVIIEDAAVGTLAGSNLTSGKGGLPADYTSIDWIRALRHGVDQSGNPLIFMPSHETTLLSAEDLSAIIAYCTTVPPVDKQLLAIKLGPVANIMGYLGKMPLWSVEKIDHSQPILAKADTTEGISQGKYLAISCTGCHRADFKGGDPVAPGLPPVPDITSSGQVGKWTQAQFIQTLRSGRTPSGHQLKNEEMPWEMTAQYETKELASLYQYFRSI